MKEVKLISLLCISQYYFRNLCDSIQQKLRAVWRGLVPSTLQAPLFKNKTRVTNGFERTAFLKATLEPASADENHSLKSKCGDEEPCEPGMNEASQCVSPCGRVPFQITSMQAPARSGGRCSASWPATKTVWILSADNLTKTFFSSG